MSHTSTGFRAHAIAALALLSAACGASRATPDSAGAWGQLADVTAVVTVSEARGACPKACPPRFAQGDNTWTQLYAPTSLMPQ